MIEESAPKRMVPNQMRYQAAPLPDCDPPRVTDRARQAERHGAAPSGVTLSRYLSRDVLKTFLTLPHRLWRGYLSLLAEPDGPRNAAGDRVDEARCTPGNHKCEAMALYFFAVLNTGEPDDLTRSAVERCERGMA